MPTLNWIKTKDGSEYQLFIHVGWDGLYFGVTLWRFDFQIHFAYLGSCSLQVEGE